MREKIFEAHNNYEEEWRTAWCKYALNLCPVYLDGSRISEEPPVVSVIENVTFSSDTMTAEKENNLILLTTMYNCRFSRLDEFSVNFFISILPYYKKNLIFYFKNDGNLPTPHNLKLYAFAYVNSEELGKYYTSSEYSEYSE